MSLLILGMPFYGNAQSNSNSQNDISIDDPLAGLQKLTQFYRYLNAAYVDTVHNSDLVESGIIDMLGKLDPHSTYVSAEELKKFMESFDGSFGGIGVEYNILKDTIIVLNVVAGGPSDKAGIRPNDRIIAVDGKSAIGTLQADVPALLRGPKNSKVNIRVRRDGEPQPLDFTVTRDDIPLNTVDAAYLVNPTTGYIKVSRFANNTFREVAEAYASFGKVDGIILDLRNNGGGLLEQAVELSNFFLKKDVEIVSMEGMRIPKEDFTASRDGLFTEGKVVILTNEASASASEIVAGAIQDWDRGIIIGRPTFGKGLVQRQLPLIDGSAIRLTVARYHTPTGRMIQRPYEEGKKDDYYEEFIRRINEGDYIVDSSLVYKTLRTGRTVYGGGGITPDIIVQMDTTHYSDYWASLVRRGVIIDYIIDYMAANRQSLESKFPTFEKFASGFEVDNAMMESLVADAQRKGIPPSPEQLAISESVIKSQLKALIAQKLWGMNEYYHISNMSGDEIYDKAVEVITNWEGYFKEILH